MIPKNAALLTLAALGPVAACAATPDSRPPEAPVNSADGPAQAASGVTPAAEGRSAPKGAIKGVDENLARLRALDVFEVGDLIVDYPEGSMNCYGPCPGSEAGIEKAKADAAAKLAKLADAAESAVKQMNAAGKCDAASVNAHIAALEALKIVHVVGLIQEQPRADRNCYVGHCPEDRACARADKLAAIAQKARDL